MTTSQFQFQHKQLGSDIFQDNYAKLTSDQQYLLKRVIHAHGAIAFDDIVSEKDVFPDNMEDALRFLANYSYITWDADDMIWLRFLFYPKLVQLDAQPLRPQIRKRSIRSNARFSFPACIPGSDRCIHGITS